MSEVLLCITSKVPELIIGTSVILYLYRYTRDFLSAYMSSFMSLSFHLVVEKDGLYVI